MNKRMINESGLELTRAICGVFRISDGDEYREVFAVVYEEVIRGLERYARAVERSNRRTGASAPKLEGEGQ